MRLGSSITILDIAFFSVKAADMKKSLMLGMYVYFLLKSWHMEYHSDLQKYVANSAVMTWYASYLVDC